jgi:hypothetical protein
MFNEHKKRGKSEGFKNGKVLLKAPGLGLGGSFSLCQSEGFRLSRGLSSSLGLASGQGFHFRQERLVRGFLPKAGEKSGR